MQSMIRSSRRSVILAVAGISALLLVVGLVYATPSCGCGDSTDETAASDNDAAVDLPLVPGASPTLPAVIDPAPAVKPTEVPPSGGGVSGSNPGLPPDAPRGSQPSAPSDPGNAASPIQTDPKDAPVSSPPLPGTVPPSPASPPPAVIALPKSDLPALKAGTKRVEAPIDGLSVATLESFPAQYLVQIQAGLPSGCAQKAGYEASISGTTITVKVYNAMPTGAVACTMIYGMYDLNLNLGSGFVSGQTYTVVVNDKTTTFKTQ